MVKKTIRCFRSYVKYYQQIVQGSNLEKKDVNGKSDPYAIISYEDQESKTKVAIQSLLGKDELNGL